MSAVTKSLILILSFGFVLDPGWIAWSTGIVTNYERQGSRSPLGFALHAFDGWLFPRAYALGPNDYVVTPVPDAFVDISAQGGTVLLQASDAQIGVELPFTFPYYGQGYTQLSVTTKGYVQLGSAALTGQPDPLPFGLEPFGVIAPFWDDLDASGPQASVQFMARGSGANQAFVVQWTNVAFKSDQGARLTFEVVLFASGEVQFHYGSLTNGTGTTGGRASGATASVGLESTDGTLGVQVGFQQAGTLAKGRSFALTPNGTGPLKRGDVRGDLNADGVVNILDQSRLAEIASRSAQYAAATARELLLADIAPQSSASFGDSVVNVLDRDLHTQAILGRSALNPVLATVSPPVANAGDTLTLDGSGFSTTAALNQVAFVTSAGTVLVPASSVDAAGTEITATVPLGLVTGQVQVVVNGIQLQFPRPQTVTRYSNGQALYPAGVPTITGVSPALAAAGDTVTLTGINLSGTAQVFVAGVPATVSAYNIQSPVSAITFTVPSGTMTGATNVTVQVGSVTSAPFPFTVADVPTAVITAPQSGGQVLVPTSVMGTASNPSAQNLTSWTLSVTRQAQGGLPAVIASGTTPVVNAQLGTFDPSLLVNGFYTLTLTVTNSFGKTATAMASALQVRGDAKVGVFTVAFQDITLKANGFDVVVNRTYDSREKRVQDFGVGWKLTLSNVDLETDLGHNIYVTLPDGRRDVFTFNPTGTQDPTLFYTHYDPTPGVFDVLSIPGIDNQQLFFDGFTFFNEAGEPFDPTDVTLTRVDGTILQINNLAGLQSISDLNGNTETFSPSGITGVGASLPFQRDSVGRITTITDPAGNSISYQYSDAGDLIAVIDRVANKATMTYDSNHNLKDVFSPSGIRAARSDYDSTGRLIATTDPDGNKTLFAHDLNSRNDTITDRLGHTHTITYDVLGDVVAQVDQLNNLTRFEYDPNRNQTALVDALGNRWTHTYNSQGLPLTDTDPLGNTTARTFDSNGHVLTTTDANSDTSSNAYDPLGNLASITDALGAITSFQYFKGSLRARTDALGNTTGFENDARGNVTFMIDALGNQTIYHYNALGNQTSIQQGIRLNEYAFVAFRSTTSQYDATGRVTTRIDTLANASGMEYDQDGHQHAAIDAAGRKTIFGYDSRGNLNLTRYPDSTTVGSTFDAEARRVSSMDQVGRITTFVHDLVGRVTDTIYPDGTATHTEFDAVGRVTTETNARGFKTSFLYDSAGRRTHVIDALGHVTTTAYDGVGNVISVTDARGNTTQFHYDALNRRDKTLFPDGTFTRVVYDALGRTSQGIDQAGKKVEYHYDAVGRQTQMIMATGAITSFVYDQLSNMIERHDALGRVTKFDHDALGRVTKTTRPLGMVKYVAYDALGRVISSTDFSGQTLTFRYDLASRLQRKALPDGRTVDFTYTSTGQRLTITDSVRGVTAYTYDARDRILSRAEPDQYVVSYTYDENGNRKSVTAPSGETGYTFDALDRLETVTSAANQISTYSYDEVGNRRALSYPNGVVANYNYDTQNRLYNLSNTLGTTIISSYTYTHGPAGNRTSVVEQSGRLVGYAYDDDYRLKAEAILDAGTTNPLIFVYDYDTAGNRIAKTQTNPDLTQEVTFYHYDDNDRLNEVDAPNGATAYAYDNNGSTTQIVDPVQTRVFTWTPERRLATATTSGTGAAFSTFEYDEDGIRVKKTRNGVGTRYVIDESQMLQEVVEEREASSGALNVSYTYGDDLIAQDRNAASRFYHSDGQLSTRQLTDASGVVTDTYTYDAFGLTLASSGSTDNVYQYSGEQSDADAEGYYLRARYYNTIAGRFLSEDELDQDGPSYHKYTYAHNNPANWSDPTGKFTLMELLVAIAIIAILATLIAIPIHNRVTSGSVFHWGNMPPGNVAGRDLSPEGTESVCVIDALSIPAASDSNTRNLGRTDWTVDAGTVLKHMSGHECVIIVAHGIDLGDGGKWGVGDNLGLRPAAITADDVKAISQAAQNESGNPSWVKPKVIVLVGCLTYGKDIAKAFYDVIASDGSVYADTEEATLEAAERYRASFAKTYSQTKSAAAAHRAANNAMASETNYDKTAEGSMKLQPR